MSLNDSLFQTLKSKGRQRHFPIGIECKCYRLHAHQPQHRKHYYQQGIRRQPESLGSLNHSGCDV